MNFESAMNQTGNKLFLDTSRAANILRMATGNMVTKTQMNRKQQYEPIPVSYRRPLAATLSPKTKVRRWLSFKGDATSKPAKFGPANVATKGMCVNTFGYFLFYDSMKNFILKYRPVLKTNPVISHVYWK